MAKPHFSIAYRDPRFIQLIQKAPHRVSGLWALECAERVLPYFTERYPGDPRPRIALAVLMDWIGTGEFHMRDIRRASLAAHAAARAVETENAARFAARAAGQAVATAHVCTHALGAANYAVQAIHRAVSAENTVATATATGIGAASAVAEERDWQYFRLRELVETEQGETYPEC